MSGRPLAPESASGAAETAHRARILARLGLLASVLLAFGVNASGLHNEFAMDDPSLIKKDPTIRSLANVPTLFATDYWMPKQPSGLYRPLVKTTYALNYAVAGIEPPVYHLTNLLLHGVVSGLLWFVFLRASRSAALATGAACLFAVHAVHTEVTANVTFGRPELLAATFFFAALLLYTRPAPRRPRLVGLASLACYALALLAKESAVTLVGVLALWDLAFRSDPERSLWQRVLAVVRQRWMTYAGYVVVTAGYLLARSFALREGEVLPPEIAIDNPLFGLPVHWRVLNALWVSLHYARLLFFPVPLAYDYSYEQIPTFQILADPRGWIGLGAWVLLIVVWLRSLRSSPLVFWALGTTIATFSVVSNFVLPIGTILGERLLYLPSAGFCLLVAIGIRRLAQATPRPRAGYAAAMALLVALHGARSLDRFRDWEDQWTLYIADVERSPGSTKAHSNAGAAFAHRRRYEDALRHLHRSIEIQPIGYPVPWATAGMVYTTLGRDDQAREMYEGAIRNGSEEPAVFNNLGFMLVDRGIDVPRGLELLERAAAEWPDDPEVLDSLGWAYFKVGRLDEAREKLQAAVSMFGTPEELAARRAHLAEVEKALGVQPSAPAPPGAIPSP